MGGPGPIDTFLQRTVHRCRAAGVDAARFRDEVADHLAEAAEAHRRRGLAPVDAERRAVEEFGEVDPMVLAVASMTRGETMARLLFRLSTVGAIAATATLVIAQAAPSQAVRGRPLQPVAVAAFSVIVAAGLALVLSWRRTAPPARPGAWVATWIASTVALGALAAWNGRVGSLHVGTGGRVYLAAIAALALLVAASAHWMRSRAAAGTGLVSAGLLALVLNGALGGSWKPLGAIGEGQANMAVELVVTGWLLGAAVWASGPRAATARRALGSGLIALGRRLTLTSEGRADAEAGTSV